MKTEKVEEIMNNITDDKNLCIIRNVLENYGKKTKDDGFCPNCKDVQLEEETFIQGHQDTVWVMKCPECKKRFESWSEHFIEEVK